MHTFISLSLTIARNKLMIELRFSAVFIETEKMLLSKVRVIGNNLIFYLSRDQQVYVVYFCFVFHVQFVCKFNIQGMKITVNNNKMMIDSISVDGLDL